MTCSALGVEEIRDVLCVMKKNLECPICLDIMKEPITTRCDHIFCRFCMLQLLSKKKKRHAQCPMCKNEVTKRSLQESPRFKLLSEGLLNIANAFEQDTGYTFSYSQLCTKNFESPSKEQLGKEDKTIIRCTGYRYRRQIKRSWNHDDYQTVLDTDMEREGTFETGKPVLCIQKRVQEIKQVLFKSVPDSPEDDILKKASILRGGVEVPDLQSQIEVLEFEIKEDTEYNDTTDQPSLNPDTETVAADLANVSGCESETTIAGDASGLSSQSEILNTQQRNVMKSNLKKLEQEMAALEAVLEQHSSQGPISEREFPSKALSVRQDKSQEKDYENEPAKLHQTKDTLRQSCVNKRITQGLTTEDFSSKRVRYCSSPVPAETHHVPSNKDKNCNNLLKPASTTSQLISTSVKSPVLSSKKRLSIVASGLNQRELVLIQKFAKKTQSVLSSRITESTTHVIMKTDAELVCERTLKYFLGIAGRKWVVSYEWIVQSFRIGRILDEYDFEVRGDVISGRSHRSPRRSRLGSDGLLLKDFEICCLGPFTDMTTDDLEWMVSMCGASVVTEPQMFEHRPNTTSLVIVQPVSCHENTDYAAIRKNCKALVVTREWLLDSVASYKLEKFDGYLV
ncbi:breast cancer type 1 susceptibility protein [Rhinophrynus dorsalis]